VVVSVVVVAETLRVETETRPSRTKTSEVRRNNS